VLRCAIYPSQLRASIQIAQSFEGSRKKKFMRSRLALGNLVWCFVVLTLISGGTRDGGCVGWTIIWNTKMNTGYCFLLLQQPLLH